jgi:uncharacterized protein YbaR (Trm112 family)
VAEIVSCPHCELKLSLKTGLKGQRLACPKCKGQFTVPNDVDSNDRITGELGYLDTAPETNESSASASDADGGMDFLSEVTGGSPQNIPVTRLRASTSSALLRGATTASKPGSGPRSSAIKSRSSKKQDSMMPVYIIGGIGIGLVLFIIGVFALNNSPAKPPEELHLGLTERTRRAVFKELIKSVDNYGMSKACVNDWRETGARYKLGDKEIEDILSEGFDANPSWDVPQFDHASANSRSNRQEWIKKRTEMKREPQFH